MRSHLPSSAAHAGLAVRLGSVAHRANLPRIYSPRAQAACWSPNEQVIETATGNRLGRLEAVLWLAQGPLPMRRLAQAAGLDGVAEARELLGALRRQLAIRQSAIEVVEVAGGVRLMTRPVFEPWLAKLAGTESKTHSEEPRLSGPALEALAIVAYRQPAVRAEVEAIRGVGCGELLRQLLEADLLRIVGRSEELGKPLLYGTTDRFLEVFGLRNLDGLPQPGEAAEGPEPTKQNAPSEWVEA